jgi:hypothetical protein
MWVYVSELLSCLVALNYNFTVHTALKERKKKNKKKEEDAVARWLRHYATNRKVAASRPDEVNF